MRKSALRGSAVVPKPLSCRIDAVDAVAPMSQKMPVVGVPIWAKVGRSPVVTPGLLMLSEG